MEGSEARGELFKALAAVQAVITDPGRTAKTQRNRYADLHSILDAVRVPLASNGLCVSQWVMPATTDEAGRTWLSITTVLGHDTGQWMGQESSIPVDLDTKFMNPAQAVGSSITYLRRYALAAALGISQQDDDGESAGQPKKATGAWKRVGDRLVESGSWPEPVSRLRALHRALMDQITSPDVMKLVEENAALIRQLPAPGLEAFTHAVAGETGIASEVIRTDHIERGS